MPIAIMVLLLAVGWLVVREAVGPSRADRRAAAGIAGGAPLAGETTTLDDSVISAGPDADIQTEMALPMRPFVAEPPEPEPEPELAVEPVPVATLVHDIVPSSDGASMNGASHYLLAPEVFEPIRAHQHARAMIKLAIVVVVVAAVTGGTMIMIGRAIGAFFTRLSG